jgi:hypothetical protein
MDFLHLFKKGAGAPKEKKDVEEETVQNEVNHFTSIN